MPQNKRHHFVPRFHLRYYSSEAVPLSERRSVSVCLVPSGRVHHNASIGRQCQRNCMYGQNGAHEKALQLLEGHWANVIGRIVGEEELPALMSDGHCALLAYIALQRGRTEVAAQSYIESNNFFVKETISSEAGCSADDVDERYEISYDNADVTAFVMSVYLGAWPLLCDLGMLLVRAPTGRSFVTSDHPIVFFNSFLHDRESVGNIGMAGVGLQILVPVAPAYSILLYDRGMYGQGRRRTTVCSATPADIDALNLLQAVNARSCIYFHRGSLSDAAATGIAESASGKRREFRTRNHRGRLESDYGDDRSLLITQEVGPDFPTELSFLKTIGTHEQRVSLERRVGVRHPELYVEFEDCEKRRVVSDQFVAHLAREAPEVYLGLRNGRRGFVGPRASAKLREAKRAAGGRFLDVP